MKSSTKKSIFGVASSRIQASRIVNHLTNAGFSSADISVLLSGVGIQDEVENARGGGTSGRGTAAAESGLTPDWFSGAGGFPPPRFNQFTAGRPTCGGRNRAAVGPASREFQDATAGQVLISLRTKAWCEADAARKIFQALGASNITLGGENAFRLLTQTFRGAETGRDLQTAS